MNKARVRAAGGDFTIADLGRVASPMSLVRRAFAAAVANGTDPQGPALATSGMSAATTQTLGCIGTVIIGFGVLGVYGVSRIHKHSATVEATRSLGAIESGLKSYAASHHRFPASGAPVPATLPRGKFTLSADAWATSPWTDVKLSIVAPHYYQFEIETAPDGLLCVARARGDLDENGVTSSFELTERIGTSGEAERVSFKITNEDE